MLMITVTSNESAAFGSFVVTKLSYRKTCFMGGHVLREDMSYWMTCLMEEIYYWRTYLTGRMSYERTYLRGGHVLKLQ